MALDFNKTSLADKALESHDFQDYQVVGKSGWDTSDTEDYIKVVFVVHDDNPDADSMKVSFHVRFSETGEVLESYALDVPTGNYLGKNPDDQNGKNLQP